MAPSRSTLRLVLLPALVTLGVTALRFIGEVGGFDERWFSRAPGGGMALVGIVWLIPLFGVYFGWRLARDGHGPARSGRAVVLCLLAVAVYVGGFQAIVRWAPFDTSTHHGLEGQLVSMGAVAVVAAVIAWKAWPALGRVELVYALCARVPTAMLTIWAVYADLDVHHAKFGPDDHTGFPTWEHAAWLAYTQLVFWPPFTMAVGGLFGALAALVAGPAPGRPAIPQDPDTTGSEQSAAIR